MKRKEWHEIAIKIIDIIEVYSWEAWERWDTAQKTRDMDYIPVCEKRARLAQRALVRLKARYNRHILSLTELEF